MPGPREGARAVRIWIVNWREKFDPIAWVIRIGVAVTTLLLVIAVVRLTDQTHEDHTTIEHDRQTITKNRILIQRNTARVNQLERCITDPACIAVPPVPTTTTTVSTRATTPRPTTTTRKRPPATRASTTTTQPSRTPTTSASCPNPTAPIVGTCPTVP